MVDVRPSQDPTGEPLPGVTDDDREALELLASEGIGEGDFDDPHLPHEFDWSSE